MSCRFFWGGVERRGGFQESRTHWLFWNVDISLLHNSLQCAFLRDEWEWQWGSGPPAAEGHSEAVGLAVPREACVVPGSAGATGWGYVCYFSPVCGKSAFVYEDAHCPLINLWRNSTSIHFKNHQEQILKLGNS